MKQKTSGKKLALNKSTVTRLESQELQVVKGGTSGGSLCCTLVPYPCGTIEVSCEC